MAEGGREQRRAWERKRKARSREGGWWQGLGCVPSSFRLPQPSGTWRWGWGRHFPTEAGEAGIWLTASTCRVFLLLLISLVLVFYFNVSHHLSVQSGASSPSHTPFSRGVFLTISPVPQSASPEAPQLTIAKRQQQQLPVQPPPPSWGPDPHRSGGRGPAVQVEAGAPRRPWLGAEEAGSPSPRASLP